MGAASGAAIGAAAGGGPGAALGAAIGGATGIVGGVATTPLPPPGTYYDYPAYGYSAYGYPGYATPAMMEVFDSSVIPKMFTSVIKGERSPDEAARAAEAEAKRIFEKWKQA